MIIGIEGTGSQKWGPDDLQRSFVRRILEQCTMFSCNYFIGPSDAGGDGKQIIDGAFNIIQRQVNQPLVLLGYSRGAAYCMYLASMMRGRGLPIRALIMFDAVARQHDFDIPDKVPDNVPLVFHAWRDPRSGSRYFFQNVGKSHDSRTTVFHSKAFMGSHGALGGTPWDAQAGESGNSAGEYVVDVDDRQLVNIPHQPVTDRAMDERAARQVSMWMWPLLQSAGILGPKANWATHARPFAGSRVPGVPNMV